MSPLEHQATPYCVDEWDIRHAAQQQVKALRLSGSVSELAIQQICTNLEFSGNFRGWTPHRKHIPFEDNFGQIRALAEANATLVS